MAGKRRASISGSVEQQVNESVQSWEKLKGQADEGKVQFTDEQLVADIYMTWLYKPHTILLVSVLISILGWAVYNIDSESQSMFTNLRIGVGLAALFVLILGLKIFPSGTFQRPHPVFWRFIYGSSSFGII